jgi:hypothetical protein
MFAMSSDDPFGVLKTQVMAKKKTESQIVNLTSDH